MDLEQKHVIERDFHDAWARSIDLDKVSVRESFEAVTALENRVVMRRLGDLKGKKVLDLGCGAGEAAVYFALQGAEVFAVDISSQMLHKANLLAERHGVTIKTFHGPVENLAFEDNAFDCVYGSSILHHADPALTIRQVVRVLKKDGTAVFIEPLSHNPAIRIYRRMAREVMTPTERPFDLKGFAFVRDHFNNVQFDFCWFLALFVFVYMYFIERIDGARDRYWKRVIREHQRYGRMVGVLDRFDQRLLRILPFLKRWCWTTVMTLSSKR